MKNLISSVSTQKPALSTVYIRRIGPRCLIRIDFRNPINFIFSYRYRFESTVVPFLAQISEIYGHPFSDSKKVAWKIEQKAPISDLDFFVDFVTFSFLPERAPLAPIWPLSELPPEQRLLLFLAGSPFPSFFENPSS